MPRTKRTRRSFACKSALTSERDDAAWQESPPAKRDRSGQSAALACSLTTLFFLFLRPLDAPSSLLLLAAVPPRQEAIASLVRPLFSFFFVHIPRLHFKLTNSKGLNCGNDLGSKSRCTKRANDDGAKGKQNSGTKGKSKGGKSSAQMKIRARRFLFVRIFPLLVILPRLSSLRLRCELGLVLRVGVSLSRMPRRIASIDLIICLGTGLSKGGVARRQGVTGRQVVRGATLSGHCHALVRKHVHGGGERTLEGGSKSQKKIAEGE